MTVQLPLSHNDWNSHHKPQACAVEDHLLHHEHSICAVSDPLPRLQFAMGGHVLPESKEEQVKQPPEPTQRELVVIAFEEEGFSKSVDVGQLF